MEKPLVSRAADLAILQALVKEHRLTVFVVANWLTSSLTGRLRERLERSADRKWSKLTISQIKPRFARSLATWGQETIFDVEIPHQIALSLLLGGEDLPVDGRGQLLAAAHYHRQHDALVEHEILVDDPLSAFLHSHPRRRWTG